MQLRTSGLGAIRALNLCVDYGNSNLVAYDDEDFAYDNEITWSNTPITNIFTNSIDMSDVTADGLTQTTVAGAPSRQGPFFEGLIQLFDSPTGNHRLYQDVVPAWTSPSAYQIVAWSGWLKSLTPGW